MSKLCRMCKLIKDSDSFYKDSRNSDGLESYCKRCRIQYVKKYRRSINLKYLYGITEKEYDSMVENQNGLCLICGQCKKLYVDHNHKTGEIRGLLCNFCNGVSGWIEKDLARLDNIAKHLGVKVQ